MSSRPVDKSPELSPYQDVQSLIALAAEHLNTEKLAHADGLPPTKGCDWYTSARKRSGVLDAIAVLCVTPAHRQSVAATVSIDALTRQVGLLLCQGGVESPDKQLATHIRKTWRLLRDVSKRKGGDPEDRLFGYIYRFQKDEVVRAFREWWPVLDLEIRRSGRSRRRGIPPDDLSHTTNLLRATLALRRAACMVDEDIGQLTAEEWGQLIALMNTAAEEASKVNRDWLKITGSGVQRIVNGCSRLWRALMELTSFHDHLRALAAYARDPMPRDLFDYTLQISFLTCPPRSLQLPAERTVIIQAGYSCYRASENIELTSTFATEQRGAPHAVCNLISHLAHHPTRTVVDVGASVPVCTACWKWIALYNYYGRHSYRVRRTDGSWRWPWVMVPGVDGALMARSVSGYLRYFASWPRSATVGIPDDEEMAEMMVEMDDWWMENSGACVFGCVAVDGCSCFQVLFGGK